MAASTRSYLQRLPCFRKLLLKQKASQLKNSFSTAASSKVISNSERIRPASDSKNTPVQLEPWVSDALVSSSLKHKQHPGRMTLRTVTVPQRLLEATNVILEKYPVKELSRKAEKLANYLWSRHPPSTDDQVTKLANETYHQLLEERESKENTDHVGKNEVLNLVRKKLYHWHPVTYDAYKSLLYLTGHLARNYSVLLQCFTEIAKRDPQFQPRAVFNFGSGLGSGVWAASSVWGSNIYEHYCVDQSQDMNTVARLLLQDGENQKQMCIPGVTFRQFSPSAVTNQFDMVVCAYTLLDQPGPDHRLQLIKDLWRMTSDVLVLVENGTTAGFSLINDARDHLLQLTETVKDERQRGHVFAPCPHDNECPKVVAQNQPCFSEVDYHSLPQQQTGSSKCSARYSYVILRKGNRSEGETWPRVIQDTVKASRHTHCHLCCADGKVRHMIFTSSKQGRDVYKCSRYTSWGDLFPVKFPAS